jgi:hypothetical protein
MKNTLSIKLQKVLEYGSISQSNDVAGFTEEDQINFIESGKRLYKFTTGPDINTKVFQLTAFAAWTRTAAEFINLTYLQILAHKS